MNIIKQIKTIYNNLRLEIYIFLLFYLILSLGSAIYIYDSKFNPFMLQTFVAFVLLLLHNNYKLILPEIRKKYEVAS